jgi:hypothetical protein
MWRTRPSYDGRTALAEAVVMAHWVRDRPRVLCRWRVPHGVHVGDIAKRLMDYGFHPPTIAFPLVVHGSIMIEPNETESREELDAFIDAMRQIAAECETDPEVVRGAPHRTVLAASMRQRQPDILYCGGRLRIYNGDRPDCGRLKILGRISSRNTF